MVPRVWGEEASGHDGASRWNGAQGMTVPRGWGASGHYCSSRQGVWRRWETMVPQGVGVGACASTYLEVQGAGGEGTYLGTMVPRGGGWGVWEGC
ncbi:hypothetical protein KY285_033122 [Solanum tuberosum]|nr:hypothetical protein KY285_033122 [Solanum tuberosum]